MNLRWAIVSAKFLMHYFDVDVDIDQTVFLLNIYEKGFNMISNPLYEEVENLEIVKIDPNVNAELISCDEGQFISMVMMITMKSSLMPMGMVFIIRKGPSKLIKELYLSLKIEMCKNTSQNSCF